jgi:DNA ligase (NAD+)
VQTKLVGIEYQVGRTGAITPVALLQEVFLAGTHVSRATLHNASEILRKDIHIGDTVLIRKAGDIIPEVLEVLPDMREPHAEKISFISFCPSCFTPLVLEKDEAVTRCPNVFCPAKKHAQFVYFVSRNALNIEGLGKEVLQVLLETKKIQKFSDLFFLTEQDFLSLPFFQEKKAKNIIESIQKSKIIPLEKFLCALGIRHIGKDSAKIIGKAVSQDIKERTQKEISLSSEPSQLSLFSEEIFQKPVFKETNEGISPVSLFSFLHAQEKSYFLSLDFIGEEMAESIFQYFVNKETEELFSEFSRAGMLLLPHKNNMISGLFSGKTCVITGTFQSGSREDITSLLEKHGAKVSSSVSSALDFLFYGKNPGSKKEKAEKLGVTLCSEEEMRRMVNYEW